MASEGPLLSVPLAFVSGPYALRFIVSAGLTTLHDVTGAANDSPVGYRFPGASDDQSLLALGAATAC